jgi:hypothetical protein
MDTYIGLEQRNQTNVPVDKQKKPLNTSSSDARGGQPIGRKCYSKQTPEEAAYPSI